MAIASAEVLSQDNGSIVVSVVWQANAAIASDYAVAVHLLAHDPPTGPEHILAQADQQHPVAGLYPVTRWRLGELVRDVYVLRPPVGSVAAVAVRIGMYRQAVHGGFENTAWLTLPYHP